MTIERTDLCILAYGGPEGPEQICPFLDRILAGKRIPSERRRLVENRYLQFGGVSPLNSQCRRFISLTENCLLTKYPNDPPRIFWGNLYSEPVIENVVQQIIAGNTSKSLLIFPAAPFDGQNGSGKYIERFQNVLNSLDGPKPECRFITSFDENSHFLRAMSDSLLTTQAQLDLETFGKDREKPFLIFTAHSISEKEAALSNYPMKLRRHGENIVKLTHTDCSWTLAYQSRSGSPRTPWLGPSVEEVIHQRKKECPDWRDLILVPIGFFFENMETVYDLDIDIAEICRNLDLGYYRAQCPGATDRCAKMLVEVL